MPAFRKRTYGSRSSARARSAPAKKARKISSTAIGKSLIKPVPSKSLGYHCQLRYCDQLAINPSIGGYSTYVFTSNGLYDPDITGTGHQPSGFDQLMSLWNEYVVVKSSIKLRGTNADPNSIAMLVGIAHEDFSTVPSDYRQYIENGSCVWDKVGARGSEPIRLTMTQDMRKFSSQDIFNENGYSGTASSNPADTHYYHIFVYTDNGADTGIIVVDVEIVYDVYFRDPALTILS